MYGEDSQQSEPDEDLAPQLLGTNTDQLSLAVPATTDPTTTATTCIQSDNHLHSDLQNHKEIMDVLNQNTRAIRCMEKTVSNQNQMRTWHHSCWAPTLINLALQYPLQQTQLQPLLQVYRLTAILIYSEEPQSDYGWAQQEHKGYLMYGKGSQYSK